jgi:hypothetical protein
MIELLPFRRAPRRGRPRLLTERGQGLALLILALALLFLVAALAKGRL